jgi:hypothetical protein
LKCEKCGSKSKPEVDHKEILFVELYENFIRERKDIPTEFENTISNSETICNSINGQLRGLKINDSGKDVIEP